MFNVTLSHSLHFRRLQRGRRLSEDKTTQRAARACGRAYFHDVRINRQSGLFVKALAEQLNLF